MKKNSLRGRFIAPLFFLLFIPYASEAISANLETGYSSDLSIIYELYEIDVPRLMENLEQKHRSRVFIQCRLYKRKELPYSIFGDELITDLEISTVAEIDLFSKTYKLTHIEEILYFEKKEDFLNHYFKNQIIIPSSTLNLDDLTSYYVKIKLTLIDKVYIKPFNIFYLTNMLNRNTTGWLHMDLKQE